MRSNWYRKRTVDYCNQTEAVRNVAAKDTLIDTAATQSPDEMIDNLRSVIWTSLGRSPFTNRLLQNFGVETQCVVKRQSL
jgi:hypothetical protein